MRRRTTKSAVSSSSTTPSSPPTSSRTVGFVGRVREQAELREHLAVASLVGYLTVGCTPDDRVGGTFDTTVDPDDCGLDALAAAHAAGLLDGVPVVLLAPLGVRPERSLMDRLGVRQCLHEPVRARALYDCVVTILAGERREPGMDHDDAADGRALFHGAGAVS